MAFQGQQGQARKVSAAEAAALVKSGMWLDWGFGLVQPDASTRRWRPARTS